MARQDRSKEKQPIGDILRARRVEVLKKGLREMAGILTIAPAHLTDIEKGRRTPSQDLLMRICKAYGIPEADLRSGWSRADVVVAEVATQDSVTAEKVPEFLRTARKLSPKQWDDLIEQARRMQSRKQEK
ncbi:MAG: helix-turn-helix transcriptional regulator [Planctomycetes bacterium]|nr:helix-turn-helix transcriptional regulator [Planctomycetota bacterium]MBI3833141.1 helix-turn-helix transcriptional regulator [Planctomycetota bacterium]